MSALLRQPACVRPVSVRAPLAAVVPSTLTLHANRNCAFPQAPRRVRCTASAQAPQPPRAAVPFRAGVAALAVAVTLAAAPAWAVECSLMGRVPCFPMPPDGKPRYDVSALCAPTEPPLRSLSLFARFDSDRTVPAQMPGMAYDPAKIAVERLKAQQAGAAPAQNAPPPAEAAEAQQ